MDDDEWREAVEEKPDYTGLKIQDLALEYSEEEDVEKNIENESQQDGPWKRAQNAQGEPTETSVPEAETPAPPAMPVSEVQSEAVESSKEESGGGDKKTEPSTKEELSKEEAAPVKKGYVPPHLRKAQEAAAAAAAAAAKAPQASVATRPTPPPAPVPTEPKPAAAAPVGKYVPVHLRNPGATPSSSGEQKQYTSTLPRQEDYTALLLYSRCSSTKESSTKCK